MRRSSRQLAVFLLVLLLLPAALQAAEPLRSGSSVLSWGVLAQLWSALTGAQADNGCEADPDGRLCHLAAATVDNGCEADPSGRCRLSVATVDNGCELDPSGRCRN